MGASRFFAHPEVTARLQWLTAQDLPGVRPPGVEFEPDLETQGGRIEALKEIARRYFTKQERAEPGSRALLQLIQMHGDMEVMQAAAGAPDPAHIVAWLAQAELDGQSPCKLIESNRGNLQAVADAVLTALGCDGVVLVELGAVAVSGAVTPQHVVALKARISAHDGPLPEVVDDDEVTT